ncbi:nucleotide exchange factor GrpE [Candidatus Saccharibacteria bacterium]|nr:nucleotide exchange factor GrpE [Candidatus Saccharibacteria bacterium]
MIKKEDKKKEVNEAGAPAAQAGVSEAKIAELTSDLQRTRADFENFRKQVEVQKLAEKKSARFATVCKVLPLLDDIERALATYEELKPLEGVLNKTLKELDLARIPSEENIEFNPDMHDAVMVEGEGEKEVVAETLRPGYYYEGEVLRPAMVKVKKI